MNSANVADVLPSERYTYPSVIAATQGLYNNGLLTKEDGGYLTSLGRD